MKDDKIKFYFPSKPLKDEDFSPIESFVLKDYYRNAFLKIIEKVRLYILLNINIYIFNFSIKKRWEVNQQKDYLLIIIVMVY